MVASNESKMAAAAILNFGKMSITLDCIKISAPNFMGRCITAPRRLPRDQRSKPEVNSCDVTSSSNERPEHKCVDLSDYSRYMIQV